MKSMKEFEYFNNEITNKSSKEGINTVQADIIWKHIHIQLLIQMK